MELIFDVGGKKQTIDLAKIAIGRSPRYGLIQIEGRSCLQVSEVYEVKTPECKACLKLRKAFVVDINRNAKAGEMHVCYEVLFDEDGVPSMLVDEGFSFLRDKKEFCRYVLWNDKTGELSVSGELDWQDAGLYSSKEFAEQVCAQLNEVLAKKPIQDATMDKEFKRLQDCLTVSNWRVIIDE